MYGLREKTKIYRGYDDFYNNNLKDPEHTQLINLTIGDFNASGQVLNPKAPCVVTTIDPEYTKDAVLQRRIRKFRMKTDILMLREITRKKFIIYATQQKHLEKQREAEYQKQLYIKIKQHQEFIIDAVRKSETSAFNEMKQTQKHLRELQKTNIYEELKKEIAGHQRLLMKVQEVYGRLFFLLKLIKYFDEIIASENIKCGIKKLEECKLPHPEEIVQLEISKGILTVEKNVLLIINDMMKVVRPYLAKQNRLNADIWIKGYENTRQKVFNYNQRLTHIVLLNHLVAIVHAKMEKIITGCTKKSIFLKDLNFSKERTALLKQRSIQVLDAFERNRKTDIIQNELNAILLVVLDQIEMKFSQNNETNEHSTDKLEKKKELLKKLPNTKPPLVLECKNFFKHNNTTEKVEKLQCYLVGFLQDMEKIPPDQCIKLENHVRKRIQLQEDISKRILAKQNRLQNWMEHFKKHEMLRYHN